MATALLAQAHGGDIQERNGHPIRDEFVRVEQTRAGPMIFIRDLGLDRRSIRQGSYVDMTFRLTSSWKQSHIAVGIGQIYPGLEQQIRSETPVDGPRGEGLVIGDSSALPPDRTCGQNPNSMTFESYYSGTVLDPASCVQLEVGKRYRVYLTVSATHRVELALYDDAGRQLATRKRSWAGKHQPFTRGFWLVPLAAVGATYELELLQVGRLR